MGPALTFSIQPVLGQDSNEASERISEGGCEDGYYDVGNRLGKESVSSSRCGWARPDSPGAPAQTPATAAVRGAAATLPGSDAGVWQRPLLGPRDCQARS